MHCSVNRRTLLLYAAVNQTGLITAETEIHKKTFCTSEYQGQWWYHPIDCFPEHLTGLYLKSAEMKIRPFYA